MRFRGGFQNYHPQRFLTRKFPKLRGDASWFIDHSNRVGQSSMTASQLEILPIMSWSYLDSASPKIGIDRRIGNHRDRTERINEWNEWVNTTTRSRRIGLLAAIIGKEEQEKISMPDADDRRWLDNDFENRGGRSGEGADDEKNINAVKIDDGDIGGRKMLSIRTTCWDKFCGLSLTRREMDV